MGDSKGGVVRIDAEAMAEVEARAARDGGPASAAASALIKEGASTERAVGAALAPITERLDSAARAQEGAAAALGESVRAMEVARKNIGKATKASEGALALGSMACKDLYAAIAAAGISTDERIVAWARLRPADIHAFFLTAGGALQRDKEERLLPALDSAMRREPFASLGPRKVVGYEPDAWRQAAGAADDAGAVQSLARGKGKKGKAR